MASEAQEDKMIKALKKLTKKKKKLHVCVFCGASNDVPPIFIEMATEIGAKLAKKGHTVVYGGGNSGLMGAVANGALNAGGEVIGIFPDILKGREAEHYGLTLLIQTKTMHERKQLMYDKSDAFIILPGGVGTMDEFFEILTWKQLGGHAKPIIIYDFMNYYERLMKLIQSMVRHGFTRAAVSNHIELAKNEGQIFEIIDRL